MVWIFWFLQKVEVENNLNRDSFIFYAHMWMLVFALFFSLFPWANISFSLDVILFTSFISLIYVTVFKLRLIALKHLDTSTYFINFRIISSIVLLFAGQLFFSEHINFKEYLGVFLWFIIFILLLPHSKTHIHKENIKKWFIYLVLWALWISLLWLIQKRFTQVSIELLSFLFFSWIFWGILSLIFRDKKYSVKQVLHIEKRKDKFFLIWVWVVFSVSCWFNLQSVANWWDVAIVYKIVSYSIFIPIILSIIFYKEKITLKKFLAFVLTIVSIWLFV